MFACNNIRRCKAAINRTVFFLEDGAKKICPECGSRDIKPLVRGQNDKDVVSKPQKAVHSKAIVIAATAVLFVAGMAAWIINRDRSGSGIGPVVSVPTGAIPTTETVTQGNTAPNLGNKEIAPTDTAGKISNDTVVSADKPTSTGTSPHNTNTRKNDKREYSKPSGNDQYSGEGHRPPLPLVTDEPGKNDDPTQTTQKRPFFK